MSSLFRLSEASPVAALHFLQHAVRIQDGRRTSSNLKDVVRSQQASFVFCCQALKVRPALSHSPNRDIFLERRQQRSSKNLSRSVYSRHLISATYCRSLSIRRCVLTRRSLLEDMMMDMRRKSRNTCRTMCRWYRVPRAQARLWMRADLLQRRKLAYHVRVRRRKCSIRSQRSMTCSWPCSLARRS